jgi:transcriptional regulator
MDSRQGRVKAGSMYGSLEMLILSTLKHGGTMHGLQISERIQLLSGESIRVEVGALYPALHRLERRGLVVAEWRISDRRRRAKFYETTPKGDMALGEEIAGWKAYTKGVSDLFRALEGGGWDVSEAEG